MNQEQNSELAQQEEQKLHELCTEDNKGYFERCGDDCDELHPDRCAMLVQQNRACQYNVIKNIINDDQNTMIGVCYWTKLIDGGHVWLIHPITCDQTAVMEKHDNHDVLKAYSHVYNKQIEFDMDLIQFIEHGPSYIDQFEDTKNHLLEWFKPQISFDEVRLKGIKTGQIEELFYSARWSRDPIPGVSKVRLVSIFSEVLFYNDVTEKNPCEDTLKRYRESWLDYIKHHCSRAKHELELERNTLDSDQDNTDTIDEIELISGMIDELPKEYEDVLKSLPNIIEIIKTWPPLLLPHPEPELLGYLSTR
jgi:hypothetical protein